MFGIAPTDLDWFNYLRSSTTGRFVNFWTPTPWSVKRLGQGDRFYFMLKSPIRKIGGYGVFSRYVEMTAAEAWALYGLGNGVESQTELVKKVDRFVQKNAKSYALTSNPTIGCIELEDIVMLDDDQFIDLQDTEHSFPSQVVKLKYFSEPDMLAVNIDRGRIEKPFEIISDSVRRISAQRKDRKGQSAFRRQILYNYGHRCCIYGETIVELLEAAHIQPYVNERSNHPQNGLCLRVDLHRLFDEGLLSISNDFTLMVSERLAGTSYAGLRGRKVTLPLHPAVYPSIEALAFQRESFR